MPLNFHFVKTLQGHIVVKLKRWSLFLHFISVFLCQNLFANDVTVKNEFQAFGFKSKTICFISHANVSVKWSGEEKSHVAWLNLFWFHLRDTQWSLHYYFIMSLSLHLQLDLISNPVFIISQLLSHELFRGGSIWIKVTWEWWDSQFRPVKSPSICPRTCSSISHLKGKFWARHTTGDGDTIVCKWLWVIFKMNNLSGTRALFNWVC